ncbi:MAG: MBOAT family protein, partial [Cyanobacteria bacterium P01_A01_bin.135]
VAIAYHLLRPSQALQNALLIAASLGFYLWGSGAQVAILLGSILLNWGCGIGIHRLRRSRRCFSGYLCGAGIALNLLLLIYYKYIGFLLGQVAWIANQTGFSKLAPAIPSVVLPIGISFFTFQGISYLADIYAGKEKPVTNLAQFSLYIAFFPQLIAGPIVRYGDIAQQLKGRSVTLEGFSLGVLRFSHGLIKKVIVADSVAVIANAAFDNSIGLSASDAWLGAIAYSMQIYFDFSGYSDMAIGLGAVFGFRLPENFLRPYAAVSVTDFWRRWHMTLSRWFRDYVYIPLGGSRLTPMKTYRNLIVVFLLTGLWHGSNWTFVGWGCYHGMLLLGERALQLNDSQGQQGAAHRAPWLRRGVTFLLVTLGWVLFRASSLPAALGYYRALGSLSTWNLGATLQTLDAPRAVVLLWLSLFIFLLPASVQVGYHLQHSPSRLTTIYSIFIAAVFLPMALALVVGGWFSPFLYFQF